MAMWPQWELALDWLVVVIAEGSWDGGGGGVRLPGQS